MRHINPIRKDSVQICLPHSKSETHRAFILGALHAGKIQVDWPLRAEDTEITWQGLKVLGAEMNWKENQVKIEKSIGSSMGNAIFLGNSGSSARFLLPVSVLSDREILLDGTERMRQRPMAQLVQLLQQLGARLESQEGFLPIRVFPSSLRGGRIAVKNLPSSQFVSALMMVAAWMEQDLELEFLDEIPSFHYVEMTARMMQRMGRKVEWDKTRIVVPSGRVELEYTYRVGKDLSAASYWVALAMIHGMRVELEGVELPSVQGDEAIFQIAEDCGSRVMVYEKKVMVEGNIVRGMDLDCRHIPDLVPTLAVLALFAPSPSTFGNVEHLRYKESDRIHAIQANLAAMGGKSEYEDGKLTVYPLRGAKEALIRTFDDHRIAMSFAIAGTKTGGLVIDNPDCVKKSYPDFWDHFQQLEKP